MLVHPQFNPAAFTLGTLSIPGIGDVGPLSVRWYGLMYLVAFLLFMMLGKWRAKRGPLPGWTALQVDDLMFYGVLGVVLGGRLGYVLFYKPLHYLQNPLEIFQVWEGGMSFHGGLLGVLLVLWLWGRRTGRSFLQVGDFVAPLVPLGLAAGRLGNFINGELWGRVTDPAAPWAMVFPQAIKADQANVAMAAIFNQYHGLPRHPSQLYQFALEGLALFVIVWLVSRKARPTGVVSGVFLTGYGSFRFLAEFAREPDDFLGLLTMHLSMGQWLSLPMILLGIGVVVWAVRRNARPET